MNMFKPGDVVALTMEPYNPRFVVVKVKDGGQKVVVQGWSDWGVLGRLFPLRTYVMQAAMLRFPVEPALACGAAGVWTPQEGKPAISDPPATGDEPA